jgi:fibro-slime domain-containing protein
VPSSICGDGTVVAGEACDDGNTSDDDGCASDCTIEAGFTCTATVCDELGGTCRLPVHAVFRDFNAHGATGGHPDFQPGFNSAGAVPGLVQEKLDSEGKPVLSSAASSAAAGGFMHGQSAFAQWYRDGAPGSGPIPGELVLWDDGSGGFVNRWGKHGEQWQGNLAALDYGTPVAGLAAGLGCSSPDQPGYGCTPGAGQQCYDPCIPWGSTALACCADIPPPNGFDGNPLFFPLDSATGVLTEPRSEGKVPSQYGWLGYPWEHEVATSLGVDTALATATAPFPSTTHNFSFTTEVKVWFRYSDSMQATISAGGDDDMWVFVNGHLAIDLGGWHVPLSGTLNIDRGTFTSVFQQTADDDGTTHTQTTLTGTAASFELVDGQIYPLQVFHAERQVETSAFKLGVRGLGDRKSVCHAN